MHILIKINSSQTDQQGDYETGELYQLYHLEAMVRVHSDDSHSSLDQQKYQ